MPEICQKTLPIRPWESEATRRLPGLNPVAPGDWLRVDDAYAAQMARREELIAGRRETVYRINPGAKAAAAEVLALVLAELQGKAGFGIDGGRVICPDGRQVRLAGIDPLLTAARLVQEDLILMQKAGDRHVLSGGVLCFPASWMLEEKFGRPLDAIHAPVAPYDEKMAQRVERLFAFLRPEAPLWRANCLLYSDPELFQPRREGDPRPLADGPPYWVRVERQCLLKLPASGAVLFSIHTCQVPLDSLGAADRRALGDFLRSAHAGGAKPPGV